MLVVIILYSQQIEPSLDIPFFQLRFFSMGNLLNTFTYLPSLDPAVRILAEMIPFLVQSNSSAYGCSGEILNFIGFMDKIKYYNDDRTFFKGSFK